MFSLNNHQNNSTKTIITSSSPSFSITSSFSPSSSSNSPSRSSITSITSSSGRLSMTPNKRLFMETISFDSNSNSNSNSNNHDDDDNENKRKKRRKNWDDFEAVSNPIVSIVVEATHTIDFDEQSKNSDDENNSQEEEEEEEEQSEFSDSDASSDMDHDATPTTTSRTTSHTTSHATTTTTLDNREQLLLATTSEEKAHFQQVWLSSPVNSNSMNNSSSNSSIGGDYGFFDLNRWRTVNFMPLPLIYRAIAVEMHKCYSESRKQHQEQEQKPQSSPSWMSVNASAEIPVKQCDMSRFLRVFHSNSSMYADYTPDLGQQQQQQQQAPPTLLSMASMYGQHEILEYLIQMKARVNTTYKTYRTPLHYCARLGHDKCMRLLLDNGADYTAETEMGNRVIHVAAAFGHLSCVKMLVEHGENVNINYTTNGTTPLQCCIPGDHVHVLRWLVENGADPMVGRFDHEAIIKALATNTLSNHNLQRQLLPIHVASQYNAVRCLQYLIDQCGIHVNLRDEKKRTPLHIACSVGADNVIDVLLKKAETDVSLRDYLGARPFHHLFTRDDAQNSMKLIRRSKNASMSLSRIAKTSERFGRTNIAKMAQRVLRSE